MHRAVLLFCLVGAGTAVVIRNNPVQELLDYYANLDAEIEKRSFLKEDLLECVEMRGSAGIYQVKSTGKQLACGVYIVGDPESQVEIEFLDFKVDCKNDGVVGVLDGWEQDGNIFPPIEDLGKQGMRQKNYCGPNSPKRIFRSTANIALIQYRLPEPGSGFLIRIHFHNNPKPCNFVSPSPDGQFMLRNFGESINCSAMIMYPIQLKLSYLDVGSTSVGAKPLSDIPTATNKCKSTEEDHVEIRGGNDIDVSRSLVFKQICGFHAMTHETHGIFCGSTIIRLVSSGRYDNTVLVDHEELKPDAVDLSTYICPVI